MCFESGGIGVGVLAVVCIGSDGGFGGRWEGRTRTRTRAGGSITRTTKNENESENENENEDEKNNDFKRCAAVERYAHQLFLRLPT